jgi:hypothetical protein
MSLFSGPRYTEEELMIRLKVFIGIILGITLFGIVFVVLYGLMFVAQPLDAISPIDSKFFELIIPIATFLTGTLSGIMLAGGNKDLQAKALEAATRAHIPSTGSPGGNGFSASGNIGGANFSFNKPTTPYASQFGAAPAAVAGAAVGAVAMSSTGKPMPTPEEEPEL